LRDWFCAVVLLLLPGLLSIKILACRPGFSACPLALFFAGVEDRFPLFPLTLFLEERLTPIPYTFVILPSFCRLGS